MLRSKSLTEIRGDEGVAAGVQNLDPRRYSSGPSRFAIPPVVFELAMEFRQRPRGPATTFHPPNHVVTSAGAPNRDRDLWLVWSRAAPSGIAGPSSRPASVPIERTLSALVGDAKFAWVMRRSEPGLSRRVVRVVVVPPLVRRRLRVAVWRVLPLFLAAQGGDVEIVPCAPHLLVTTVVDEVRAEDPVALTDERV